MYVYRDIYIDMCVSTKKLKKIYGDTRFRTSDSSSTSNFRIQLQDILHFEENTSYLINEISFPNTFRSVETGINDKLYIADAKGIIYELNPTSGVILNIYNVKKDIYTMLAVNDKIYVFSTNNSVMVVK